MRRVKVLDLRLQPPPNVEMNMRAYPMFGEALLVQLVGLNFFALENIREINASGTFYTLTRDGYCFPCVEKLTVDDGLVASGPISGLRRLTSLSLRNAIFWDVDDNNSGTLTPVQLCGSLGLLGIQQLNIRGLKVLLQRSSRPAFFINIDTAEQDGHLRVNVSEARPLVGTILT